MGPLEGVRVVELAHIGPCPMCAMLLAELGADVLKIDRIAPSGLGVDIPPEHRLLERSRRSAAVDLKHPEGAALVLALCGEADILIEGFRPGATERLGLGPEQCRARNPRLVYGRVTGWGQTGPLAHAAGHDLNYIALSGVLAAVGRAGEAPTPPLNLVGDFGGGALYLALGVVAALVEARRSGKGQVVDAAMIDGAASLMTATWGLAGAGVWDETRGTNLLDSGAPFYEVYETSDGQYIALAPIEPKFHAGLLERIGAGPEELPHTMDRSQWPALKARLASIIGTRTRAEWMEVLEGSDACFAPVLGLREAAFHPHNRARDTFIEAQGHWQPNAAPRFSRTPSAVRSPPAVPGAHTRDALGEWGVDSATIGRLLEDGVIAQAPARAAREGET